jgi:hypothetical protein
LVSAAGRPDLLQRERQLLCRFSDAGNDDLTTRSGGRRPKSAKARSRDVLGTGWQRALWRFQISIGVDWGRDASTTRPDARM